MKITPIMNQITADISNHRATRAPHPRLPLLAACALLALAPAALAQPVTIETSTTISTKTSLAANSSIIYQIADAATLTFLSTGASGGNGGAFDLSATATGAYLQIGPATANGNGWTVFKGFASSQGGSINVQSGTVSLTNVTFDGNSATNNGGAIRVSAATAFITNGTFVNNYAAVGGGAIQNTAADSRLDVINIYFANNRAATNGGAFNTTVNAVNTLTDITFKDNWAGGQGGAYFSQPGTRATAFNLTGANGITDFLYTGNAAGGSSVAITAEHLGSGIAPFAPSAAAGGFLYVNSAGAITFGIASGVTLTIGDANAASRAYDSIAGASSGVLNKTGNGSMTLNADNSYYLGAFNVTGGKLILGNTEAKLGGAITVNTGATLAGVGSLATSGTYTPTSLTLNPGSTLDIGLSTAASGTLTVNGPLSLTNATINYDLFGLAGANYISDQLNVTGALTAVTSTISIGAFATGTYNLGNLASIISNLTPILASGGSRQSLALDVSGADLLLIASADQSRHLAWIGGAPGGNILGANPGAWSEIGGAVNEFAAGDQLVFGSGASAANRSLTIAAAGVTLSEMTVSEDGYTFGGAGGITTGTRHIQPAANPADTVNATGKLIKTGAGTLTFANTAPNNFENGIELDGGVIAFNRGDQLATAADIEFTGSGTLRATANITSLTASATIGAGNTAAFDTNGYNINTTGAISGATGTLVKLGDGALTFNAGATSAYATQVTRGALILTGGNLGGSVTINTGATFGGAGAVTGPLTAAAGSTIDIGISGDTPATLTLGDLSFTNATLTFDLFGLVGDTYVSDRLLVTGNLDLASTGTILINAFRSGTYNLGNLGALATADRLETVVYGGSARQSAGVIADATGTNLLLVAGADRSRLLYWTGNAGMTLGVSAGSWTDGAAINEFASGDKIVFDNTHDTTTSRAITINNPALAISEMLVEAGSYTFTGTGGIVSGTRFIEPALDPADTLKATGKLIKNGAGTLTFENTGANNFEGGIEINAGVLAINNTAQIGAKDTTGADRGITFTNTGTLRANASLTLATNITIATPATAAALDTNGNTITYTGAITLAAATGTLAKVGSGTLIYSSTAPAPAFALDIRADTLLLNSSTLTGSVNVRDGATLAGTGAATGTGDKGVFLDAGSTLQVQNTLAIANLLVQGNATLTGSGTLSGAGAIATGATATIDIATASQLTLSTNITGATGALAKTGSGALVLGPAANLSINTLAHNAGLLHLRPGATLSAATSLTIAPAAELTGAGAINTATLVNAGIIRVGNAADATAPYGTLAITAGNYTGDNGAIHLNATINGATIAHDQLSLRNATINGDTTLILAITSTATPTSDQIKSLALIDAAGATLAPGAFLGMAETARIEVSDDIYDYAYSLSQGGWYRVGYISPLTAMLGMDAAALLNDSATLDSASNHINTLRAIAHQPKARVWFNTIYRNDKISSLLYDGATASTRGAQVGADWGNAASAADDSLAIGVFYDYTTTDLDTPSRASSTNTTANGLGAYFAYGHGRWYATGIYHRSFQKHTVNAPGNGTLDNKARAWSVSLEAGYKLLDTSKWKAELYGQYNYQTHNLGKCTDAEGVRLYEFAPVNSSVLRGGARVWRDIEFRSGAILRPWLRASYAREQNARTRLKVTTLKNDLRWDFENDMSGSGAAIEAGLSLELGNRFLLTAGGSWYSVGKIESHSLNFGATMAW